VRLLLGLGLALVATLGLAAPASAAATSHLFMEHRHSTGGLAATLSGDFEWLNRSVSVDDVKLTIETEHRISFDMDAYAGDTHVAAFHAADKVATGKTTYYYDPFVLDASTWRGGITRIYICVVDETHDNRSCKNIYR
jgi:hypothetical protein